METPAVKDLVRSDFSTSHAAMHIMPRAASSYTRTCPYTSKHSHSIGKKPGIIRSRMKISLYFSFYTLKRLNLKAPVMSNGIEIIRKPFAGQDGNPFSKRSKNVQKA